jgi:hypothetical protein
MQSIKLNMHTTEPIQTRPRKMSLEIKISNGNPGNDARLRFDFNLTKNHIAQVWLARLPRLRNADAFPRQLDRNRWELALDAVAETQPLEVISFCPENAELWQEDSERQRPAHTELLILALHDQFNISLREHK